MNVKLKWGLAATALAVVLIAAYIAYDRMTGNHVEIETLITADGANEQETVEMEGSTEAGTNDSSAQDAADAESGENPGAATTDAEYAADGNWTIQPESKVYFSITTSRETVNYEMSEVSGFWNFGQDGASAAAEGVVHLSSMSSGSNQRDNHVKGKEYLDVAQYPEASFTATSFDGLPDSWTEGEVVSLTINGELTVKDIAKEVSITARAVPEQGVLKLEGGTVVTFGDFGMTSPHTIVMDSENDIAIELRLILAQS